MSAMLEILSNLYHFDELIRLGGYTALCVIVFAETGLLAGFFLPGDSLLVTAGLIASAPGGPLKILPLIGLLCAAAVAGDSTGYAIGYHLGPRVFNRENSRFFHKDHLVRTQRFYEKHGPKTIVLARLVPFVRTFAPTVAGVGRMRYPLFLFYNMVGGIGWVCGMTLTGYFLGRLIPDIDKYLHLLIAAVIGISFIPIWLEWKSSRLEKS